MNSCLIFGFGRSGTSMLGGLLSRSGYFTGENSYAPRNSNPLGFFEDAKINNINERILEKYDFKMFGNELKNHGKTYSPFHPRYGHRWLSFIDPASKIACDDSELNRDIAFAVNVKKPFAYKDPRFSYTLNIWRKHLDDNVKYICMFRDPAKVVNSVIEECSIADYLDDFYINKSLVYQLWLNCYRYILDSVCPEIKSQLIFISYDHFITGDMHHELSVFLDTEVVPSFIDISLNRAIPDQQSPSEIRSLYDYLLKLSVKSN